MNNVANNVRKLLADQPRSTVFSLLFGAIILVILLLFSLFPEFISPYDPYELHSLEAFQAPNDKYIFGTDSLGRDILSRVIYGTQISLFTAVVAVAIAVSIGSILAVISGYHGGKIDRVLLTVMDTIYSFPSFILALMFCVMLGGATPLNVGIAVGISTIPTYFRVNRSLTLLIKERTFIEAERSIGASDFHIIFRHILPRCLPSTISLATLGVATAILTISALGFLGVGVAPPTPEWGLDLNLARRFIASGLWWLSLFPGLMIFVTALGFNLVGEALREMTMH